MTDTESIRRTEMDMDTELTGPRGEKLETRT